MAGKPFYLRLRGQFWYARMVDPATGNIVTTRNTTETNKDKAYRTAMMWSINGLPKSRNVPPQPIQKVIGTSQLLDQLKTAELGPQDAQKILAILKKRGLLDPKTNTGSRDVVEWLLEFYDYERSPYVKEKLAQGHSIGRRHCLDIVGRINTHWKPAFQGKAISDITRADLKQFSLALKEKGLAPSSINKTIGAGKVAFTWAKNEGLIVDNPAEKLLQFSGETSKRDILSDEETEKLFQAEWTDERAKIGNLVAATCGLRSGEILALRVEDVGQDRLHVRHSWNFADGLKCPKNGEERQVPLLPFVRSALLDLAKKNPWNDGFIFYSTIEGKPVDQKMLLNGLITAMDKIGIDVETRKSRNIVFHSWRHRYATKLSDRVDARSLSLSTGHKTPAMLKHYADHANEEHFKAVMEATSDAFPEPQHQGAV